MRSTEQNWHVLVFPSDKQLLVRWTPGNLVVQRSEIR